MGLSINEIEELELGFIFDIFTEKANDELNYPEIATQDDFDNF